MSDKREKFATRTIVLDNNERIRLARDLLINVPMDKERPLEMVVRERPKVRGLDQNGLYWLRLGEIAEQGWFNGRKFDADTWHYYCGRNVMPEMITTKDGVYRSKWVEAPDGEMRIISTTLLEKGCFADYTHAVEAFGAGIGVLFSANQRDRQ